MKTCTRCGKPRPAAMFAPRARVCTVCRAEDEAPKATETEWQATVVAALRAFGWECMHVRRSRGKHGKWTTATSSDGWPDVTAIRGALILGIEVKTDVGKATDEQLAWLARFHRLAGGRAWIVRPSDPDWNVFVGWLRDPLTAPRRHGW